MYTRNKIAELTDKINEIYDSEDVFSAREKIKKELEFWRVESAEMMLDRENRVLFAAGVIASFLLGVMLCILF